MKNEPILSWDAETGVASCILTDGEKYFVGTAVCHEDDADMCSEKTGTEIAIRRANIKALRVYRDELKIKLKALNQLYFSINKSKKFNEKSYENRMLQRQIRLIKNDLESIKETIASEEQSLRKYIVEKDAFYKITRTRRNKVKTD